MRPHVIFTGQRCRGKRGVQNLRYARAYHIVEPDYENDYSHFSPACNPLCQERLRRPHLSILKCYYRKVYYGKIENGIPARIVRIHFSKTPHRLEHYDFYLRWDHPLWRKILVLRMLRIAEMLLKRFPTCRSRKSAAAITQSWLSLTEFIGHV